ncbi:retrovirus-related Pol polyprotein from transposon 17.6 [Trichonephila clavipes]|nr:retrovirus-related Pol polyprotein from transposon 17.6 [Trichonephila clavipes]
MLQSTNEPTESRRLKDASFIEEVQKMLDEGIVQPSESPWSSPIVLEAGLKLNSKKCLFAAQEVKILGHLVSSNGVRPDPDKIKAVRNFPTPKNIHDIRSFLGLCSYFRRFIKGFCYLAEPLQSLLKSGVEFHWGPEEVEAFNSLKKALTSDPVLGMYDERASTEIHTDASGGRGNGNIRQIFSSHDEYEPCDGTEKGSRPCEIKTFEQLIQTEEFRFIDGILCRKNFDPDGKLWLPVIPKHLRADILRHFHDAPTAGHLGFAKTYDRIRKRFYWPGMYRNVVRYVMHCRECQRRKSVPQRPPGHLVPIPPAIAPFHRIGIDLLGRFPNREVDEIAKFLLEEIVLRHGAPRVIITDRGAVFRSRLVSSLDLCNIDHRFTTAYHPQTNGLTERFNKTLADMLSMYVDVEQKNWDEILPFVTFAYNTAKQETTAARAEESRQLARVHTLRAQDKDRRRYDSKHQMVSYAPGDLVWVYTPVLDESRSFFRVHTGYFSNIPKCIKAEFIASWACSQSSVVSSSKR